MFVNSIHKKEEGVHRCDEPLSLGAHEGTRTPTSLDTRS